MALEILVFAIPVVSVILFWLWRSRRIGRSSNVLPIFLLGYLLVLGFKGNGHDADIWSSAQDGGDLLLLFVGNTVAALIIGGIGLLIVASVAETFGPILLFDYDNFRLILAADRIKPNLSDADQPTQKAELESIQLARQLAIQECAEEAYRHIVENGRLGVVDRDDNEAAAAELRDLLLSIGCGEGTYLG